MKHILYIIFVVGGLMAVAAHAAGDLAGVSYEIRVTSGEAPAIDNGCIHFGDDGRFTLSGDTLSMLWQSEAHASASFMAVTAPGPDTDVPYHVGVYGSVESGRGMSGYGIDEFGNTFAFVGNARDDCGVDEPERRSTVDRTGSAIASGVDPRASGLRAESPNVDALRNKLRDIIYGPVLDPCWTPPGWSVPCDPPTDPLGDGDNDEDTGDRSAGAPQIAGRNFRMTLGTGGEGLRDYCWSFDPNGKIRTAAGETMAWAARTDPAGNAAFALVGAGSHGQGMAYKGSLVGSNLLQAVGIEAFDGKTTVTYGYGRATQSCAIR